MRQFLLDSLLGGEDRSESRSEDEGEAGDMPGWGLSDEERSVVEGAFGFEELLDDVDVDGLWGVGGG